jgi:hypothetical protein
MELTKEYFDKGIENLGKRFDDLATKDDLNSQTTELHSYVQEAFEVQQTYMEERFKEIKDMLDVRNEMRLLRLDVENIKRSLRLQQS